MWDSYPTQLILLDGPSYLIYIYFHTINPPPPAECILLNSACQLSYLHCLRQISCTIPSTLVLLFNIPHKWRKISFIRILRLSVQFYLCVSYPSPTPLFLDESRFDHLYLMLCLPLSIFPQLFNCNFKIFKMQVSYFLRTK